MTDDIPDFDGCPWPIDPACLEDEWETEFDEATKARAVSLASLTLRRLCAFRVGGCPITVRPVLQTGCSPYGGWGGSYTENGFIPYQGTDGQWRNAWCGSWFNPTHQWGKSIPLLPPVGPVGQVKVDGALLVEDTDFWVSGNRVIRLGEDLWPTTQNLDLPDTEAGTFSITYQNSYPVDHNGAYAAAKLAMEYARACSGKKCALPSTVTSVIRQGVSYTLPAGSFPNGETGIREVDAYIALWNPAHRKQGPKVYVP